MNLNGLIFETHLSLTQINQLKKLVLLLHFSLFLNGAVFAQNERFDLLRSQLDTAQTDQGRAEAYIKLIRGFISFNADSSHFYAEQALDEFADQPFYSLFNAAYSGFGAYYYKTGKTDSSLYYFEQAVVAAEETNNPLEIATAISNVAILYAQNGKNEKALSSYLRALEIHENAGTDFRTLLSIQNNIGIFYSMMGDNEKAISYFKRNLKMATENKVENSAINANHNLGELYRYDRPDSAIYFLNAAKDLATKIGKEVGVINAVEMLGHIYLDLGQNELGIDYLNQAKSFYEQNKNGRFLGALYQELGGAYLKEADYTEALSNYTTAVDMFRTIDDKSALNKALYGQAMAFDKLGKSAMAFDALFESRALTDTLFKQESSAALAEMQTKYETDQKDKVIELQQSQLSRQRLVQYGAIGGVVLLGLIVGLLYRNNKLKAEANVEIEAKNVALSKAYDERGSLLKEIHHRVKNNLQVITSLLFLQSYQTKDPEVKALLKECQSRVRSMALIHQKLYENQDLKQIPFADYLKDLIGEIQVSYGELAQDVSLQIEADDIFFDVHTALPLGLIINELTTNAFKYAFDSEGSGEKLNVSIKKEGNDYLMKVSDNGKGIPDQVLTDTKSESLGLKLTRILSEQLEGEYNFDNSEGTTFALKFSA